MDVHVGGQPGKDSPRQNIVAGEKVLGDTQHQCRTFRGEHEIDLSWRGRDQRRAVKPPLTRARPKVPGPRD
jgi:hypothetical protein